MSKAGKIPDNQTRFGQIWCTTCASSDIELPGLELAICRHCGHCFDPILPKVWSPVPEQSKPETSSAIVRRAMARLGYNVTESNPSINPKEISIWRDSPSKVIAVLRFDSVTGEWSGSDKELVKTIREICR